MRRVVVLAVAALAGIVGLACSDSTNAAPVTPPDPSENDAGSDDIATDSGADHEGRADDAGPTGQCADTFGSGLTAGFGRIDGIVWAVQKPSDTQCTMPNSDHVIVQVSMNGAIYRLVANVQSDQAAADGGAPAPVGYLAKEHALPEPAFAEGWHTGVELDYPTALDVHTEDFTADTLDGLVAKIVAEVKVGAPISIYAQSGSGRPSSAHLIHRYGKKHDGAIVVAPQTSPKFLLFRFAEQSF